MGKKRGDNTHAHAVHVLAPPPELIMRPQLVRNREDIRLGVRPADVDGRKLRRATAGTVVGLDVGEGVARGVERGERVGGTTGVGLFAISRRREKKSQGARVSPRLLSSKPGRNGKTKTHRQPRFSRNTARPPLVRPPGSKHLRPPTPLTRLPHPLQHLDARERLDRRPRAFHHPLLVGVRGLAVRTAGAGGGLEGEDLAAVLVLLLLEAKGRVEAWGREGRDGRRTGTAAAAERDGRVTGVGRALALVLALLLLLLLRLGLLTPSSREERP